MYRTTILIVVLFFLLSSISFAQQVVKGIVKDSITTKAIPYVNILIKTTEGKLIDFTNSDKKGNFSKELPQGYKELIIETSVISHLKSQKKIKIEDDTTNIIYTLNFTLKERINALEEVYIEAKKPPITVKNDTTVYNINKFKDGSERVVEDILKKLPGITVEDNGLIKFKGKTVTRLLLDNDNIFDSNYSVGTKNISSDIIEGVEAFEDYDDNPLLKGVKTSQQVAINLKLKEGKTDVSGSTELGAGIDAKQLARLNLLSVSKKLKGFGSFSYNNVGDNYSPYNFVSNNLDISRLQELSQRSTNLVNGGGFNSVLPDNRTRVNNNFFGSLNTLFKLNKKTTLRLNYNLFSDKLIREEESDINNTFGDQQINFSINERLIKRPTINTLSYELRYTMSKLQLLTSEGKFDAQDIQNISEGFNNTTPFTNTTTSNDIFFNNSIEYSNKYNKNSVFQTVLDVSYNNLPQEVTVSNEQDLRQDITFRKNRANLKSVWLSKQNKNAYNFELGYNFTEDFIDTDLVGANTLQTSLTNDIYYRVSKPFLNLDYRYRIKKWSFGTNLRNEFFNINLTDINLAEDLNTSIFTIYPSVSVNHFFTKKVSLNFNYQLSNNLPDDRNLFSGLVLVNNRSFLNNDFQFDLLNNQSFNLSYRINDFYNLFQFNLYSNYSFNKFGYISQLSIDEDVNFSTSILDVTNNQNLNFGLRSEKYIHFLKSTVNLNSNYSISEFQNIINASELRDNTSKNFVTSFDIRTGFKGALNFRNKMIINNNVFSSEGNPSNSFTAFQNDFSIKYIKENFQFTVDSQYFKPDLNSNIQGDLFLDANIIFKPKKSKIQYMLRANNLLNRKVYQNINTSDFSTTLFQHNLQERFLLLSASFRF